MRCWICLEPTEVPRYLARESAQENSFAMSFATCADCFRDVETMLARVTKQLAKSPTVQRMRREASQ